VTTPRRPVLLALLVLAASAVYLNALANGFALDDVYIIQRNPRVHDLTDLRAIWLTPYWPQMGQELGLYRPLAIFAYALQWSLAGGEAWLFHAVSLLLHAAATLLAFLLLERLTATVAAFAGALVFAVHPVHTEAVANVVGQAELIAAVAVFGACLLHASRPAHGTVSWPRRGGLLLLFLIALLAKENAVVLPGLLVAVDAAHRRVVATRRSMTAYGHAMLVPLLLMVAAFGVYLLVRLDALGGYLTGVDAGPSLPFLRGDQRVVTALRAFPELLRLLFFPFDLAADYSPAMLLPPDGVTPMVIGGGVLLFALGVLALLTPVVPAVGFPAAWFLLSIVTVSNLFFPIGVLIAERTLYLPSFAVAALIAWAWRDALPVIVRRYGAAARQVVLAAGVVCIGMFGYRTWTRNPDWKSTAAVQVSMLRDHPESYRAQWVYANNLWQRGRIDDARARFLMAYRLYDGDSQFLAEYGHFLLYNDEPARAVRLLEQAYALHDYVPRSTALLAHAYVTVGRYADALRMISRAEQLGVALETTLPLRAYAHEGLGDQAAAVVAWRAALRHTRTSWRNWAFLARTLARSGFNAEALAAAGHASAAAPDSAAAALVEGLRTAIMAECYGPRDPDSMGMREAAPREADCDPLGSFFDAPLPAQNANPLQNAITGSLPPRGRAVEN
jgi:protein O-mannosyl-transferase